MSAAVHSLGGGGMPGKEPSSLNVVSAAEAAVTPPSLDGLQRFFVDVSESIAGLQQAVGKCAGQDELKAVYKHVKKLSHPDGKVGQIHNACTKLQANLEELRGDFEQAKGRIGASDATPSHPSGQVSLQPSPQSVDSSGPSPRSTIPGEDGLQLVPVNLLHRIEALELFAEGAASGLENAASALDGLEAMRGSIEDRYREGMQVLRDDMRELIERLQAVEEGTGGAAAPSSSGGPGAAEEKLEHLEAKMVEMLDIASRHDEEMGSLWDVMEETAAAAGKQISTPRSAGKAGGAAASPGVLTSPRSAGGGRSWAQRPRTLEEAGLREEVLTIARDLARSELRSALSAQLGGKANRSELDVLGGMIDDLRAVIQAQGGAAQQDAAPAPAASPLRGGGRRSAGQAPPLAPSRHHDNVPVAFGTPGKDGGGGGGLTPSKTGGRARRAIGLAAAADDKENGGAFFRPRPSEGGHGNGHAMPAVGGEEGQGPSSQPGSPARPRGGTHSQPSSPVLQPIGGSITPSRQRAPNSAGFVDRVRGRVKPYDPMAPPAAPAVQSPYLDNLAGGTGVRPPSGERAPPSGRTPRSRTPGGHSRQQAPTPSDLGVNLGPAASAVVNAAPRRRLFRHSQLNGGAAGGGHQPRPPPRGGAFGSVEVLKPQPPHRRIPSGARGRDL